MPNTREKLIELLEQINGCCPKEDDCYHCKYEALDDCSVYAKADFFIANGVTIPILCKDCKHYIAYSKSVDDLIEWGKCKLIDMDVDMPGNGYCCYGERINNEK